MQRYRIRHHTTYHYDSEVWLEPHALRLRPRAGHELRIEASWLRLSPPATLRWHRDVEDNSVAIASFSEPARSLTIESEVLIQQYHQAPLDFVVDPEALFFPFHYGAEEQLLLAPYRQPVDHDGALELWVAGLYAPGEHLETYALLERISACIHGTLRYVRREEPGVQTPTRTLCCGSGSCRDFATLLMAAARLLGLGARFVSGYVHDPSPPDAGGSTHAWAEVYLPGAGWTGFDPTSGGLAGPDHIAVAVSHRPDAVPPVAGSFRGWARSTMTVGVWVTQVDEQA
ncbi:MAG: transglutaminase N-terminal domain-containing protein [Synechococcaceae cyanobacterium]